MSGRGQPRTVPDPHGPNPGVNAGPGDRTDLLRGVRSYAGRCGEHRVRYAGGTGARAYCEIAQRRPGEHGMTALAEDAFERAIASTERDRGAEDPDLIIMLGNLATVNLAHRQFRGAEERFRRELAIAERSFGPDQITSMRPLIGLARQEFRGRDISRTRPKRLRPQPPGLPGMGWLNRVRGSRSVSQVNSCEYPRLSPLCSWLEDRIPSYARTP